MAVPKKQISTRKADSREAHDARRNINTAFDSETGEAKLSHRVPLKDGFYKGRQDIVSTIA